MCDLPAGPEPARRKATAATSARERQRGRVRARWPAKSFGQLRPTGDGADFFDRRVTKTAGALAARDTSPRQPKRRGRESGFLSGRAERRRVGSREPRPQVRRIAAPSDARLPGRRRAFAPGRGRDGRSHSGRLGLLLLQGSVSRHPRLVQALPQGRRHRVVPPRRRRRRRRRRRSKDQDENGVRGRERRDAVRRPPRRQLPQEVGHRHDRRLRHRQADRQRRRGLLFLEVSRSAEESGLCDLEVLAPAGRRLPDHQLLRQTRTTSSEEGLCARRLAAHRLLRPVRRRRRLVAVLPQSAGPSGLFTKVGGEQSLSVCGSQGDEEALQGLSEVSRVEAQTRAPPEAVAVSGAERLAARQRVRVDAATRRLLGEHRRERPERGQDRARR